jgi:hypothetical protein
MHTDQQKVLFFSADESHPRMRSFIADMGTAIDTSAMVTMGMTTVLITGRTNMSAGERRLVGAGTNTTTASPLLILAARGPAGLTAGFTSGFAG